MTVDRSASALRVVIIGAGVAGLSAAMHSARLGARSVRVLEAKSIAAGSSGLSAGIVNRQTFDPIDLALRVASGEEFALIEQQTSFRITRCGYMRLARTAEQWERTLQTFGAGDYPATRLLSREEVAALVPGMRVDDVHGAMYGAEDGHMDGPELSAAMLELARAAGAEYSPAVELLGSTSTAGGVSLDTTAGTIEADIVINAAGPWFSRVGERLGVLAPIDNQRHEIAMVEVPSLANRDVPTVQTYFPGSGEDAVYVRPEGRGRFIAGLHSYESTADSVDPDDSTRSVSEDYIEALAEALIDRFPGWEDAGLDAGWSGIYPLSPDGRFIIGPHPENERVIALGGLGGVGLTVSPAVGRMAAEWAVLGECRSFGAAEPMLPGRFSEGARS